MHSESNGDVHMDHLPVNDWSSSEVAVWLQENGFERYVKLLTVAHSIDGNVLLHLEEADLRRPPVSIPVLGDIKRLALCIEQLKASSNGHTHRRRSGKPQSDLSSSDCEDGPSSPIVEPHNLSVSRRLKPEPLKLLVSYIYMFIVFMLTAFVMVIVHDRVPDMDRYPPLPDIVLDNLPYIPWAFEMCEATAIVLMLGLSVLLLFHKHRFIIMRRIFALSGTVFMLRCITMLITSLSVPGVHLKCQPKGYGNLWSKVERAIVIWTGFGMSLKGVRTCGDYMFSGHTVAVTLLNFFITEYTPRGIPMLHTFCWILNIFGIFFILAGHEHYSIDVFVAFYISSRLFLYYHTLANNRALRQPDNARTRTWFPLFSYFESSIDGIVPNEYELPFPRLKDIRRWFARWCSSWAAFMQRLRHQHHS